MQHPEFEEGPCTTSRPNPVPGLDAKSRLGTDPEQVCKQEEQAPRLSDSARTGTSNLRT